MSETLTSQELYEYRKVLVDWRWKGPEHILKVISILNKSTLNKDALIESKLYKSVYCVRSAFRKPNPEEFKLYNKDQVQNIQIKLRTLHNTIKEIVSKHSKRDPKNNVFQVKKDTETTYYGDYFTLEQRKTFTQKLVDYFHKIKDQKSNKDYLDQISFNYTDQAQQLCQKLEQKIYEKHYGQQYAQQNYTSDIRTLQQYLQKDKTGQVLLNLFQGVLSLTQASQLQMKDWLDDNQLREMEHRNRSYIEDGDADYYRQLRINEMTQAKGQECPKCHNHYLYMIDEKQIRRADEPATLFYECFACQHRYKV